VASQFEIASAVVTILTEATCIAYAFWEKKQRVKAQAESRVLRTELDAVETLSRLRHADLLSHNNKQREIEKLYAQSVMHHIKLVEDAEKKHAKALQLVRHLESVLERHHIKY
jgi:hypothetical protein